MLPARPHSLDGRGRPRTGSASRHSGAVAALTACALLTASLAACSTTDGSGDASAGSGADDGGQTGGTGTGDGSGLGLRSAAPSPEASADGPATLPTFDTSSTVGGYAPTFPRDLLGAPDDATVLASSAAPGEGRLLDVSLSLTTGRSAQEVVDQIAGPLLKAGFEESETAAFSGLTAQTTYTRSGHAKKPATETVVLGVLDVGDERLVTVSGSVLP